ncbi:MAG TPA: LysE family transporter [Burkholderiaceae bacterium]|nr:LysE family transporter [Burkholderiaceae bacterium]
MDPMPDLPAFVAFAAVGSFTPGPNTTLALAIGARFGWRRVGGHALGVAIGLSAMLALAALGAVGLLQAVPGLEPALRAAGVAWLLWLGWKVARGGRGDRPGLDRPLAAWQSALLQLANAKAWMLCVAVAATWSAAVQRVPALAAVPIVVFAAMTTAANLAWAALGQSMQAWLAVGSRRAWFDRAMGALLAASALAMLR